MLSVWTHNSPADIHLPHHQFKILDRNPVGMHQDCHPWEYIAPCNNHPDRHYLLVRRDGEDRGRYFWVTSAALSVSLLRFGFLKKKKQPTARCHHVTGWSSFPSCCWETLWTVVQWLRCHYTDVLNYSVWVTSIFRLCSKKKAGRRSRDNPDRGCFVTEGYLSPCPQYCICSKHETVLLTSRLICCPQKCVHLLCQNSLDFSHANSFQFSHNKQIFRLGFNARKKNLLF